LDANPVVQDRNGRMVYLPYAQTEGGYRDPILNRAEHVTCTDEKPGAHHRNLHPEKAKWLAAVVETIKNAPVRVHDGNEILYFRSYAGYTHQVTTSGEGVFLDHKIYESGLVTQYPVHLRKETYDRNAWVELLK